MRPPQLRCVFFSSMYLPHLLVLPATFWTSVPFATLSVFPSLICGSCPSGQRFAYSFFQIPSHGGHPCCSAMCFVVAYAHLGLSPIRKRPCWANKKAAIPTFHGITASFNSTSYFIAFFQRIVSCIILPPVFLFRFPFAPYILTLSSRTFPPFAQILPAPSTLRYTLCPHSLTFWQPASAYFPVPVSFLFEFPFSFHELHHALLPVP